MKSPARITLWCVILLELMGCTQQTAMERFTPTGEDKMARDFIEMIRESRIDDAMADLDFEIQGDKARGALVLFAEKLGGGQVKNIEEIGAHTNTWLANGRSSKQTNLTYQLELSNGWFVVAIAFKDEGGRPRIFGAHLDPIPESLEATNRFTFVGKHWIHYLFFIGAIVLPSVSLIALFLCIRTRLKRKWLWVVFIVFGFLTIRLNWTTGAIGVQPISFQLFSVSVFAAGFCAPWIIGLSAPIGAIVFLFKRRSLALVADAVSAPIASGAEPS